MSAAVAKTVKKDEAPTATEIDAHVPLVKPTSVTVDMAGQLTRHIVVRMPQRAVADDVRNPKIWRAVQAVPQSALVKLDRLLVLAYDESWAVEAVVKHASGTEVILAIGKIFTFDGVSEGLFRDELYEVAWNGSSYDVRRRVDKVVVAGGHASEGLAIDGLKRQYPRKVPS